MHTYEEYPHGGWHYVVGKFEGEAKFLHSIQITRFKWYKSGNYFYYSFEEGSLFDPISVSVEWANFSDSTRCYFERSSLAGYIGFPGKLSMQDSLDALNRMVEDEFSIKDCLDDFRTRSHRAKIFMHGFRGEAITKSQYETYKLMTDLPVLTCRPWPR